MDARNAGAHRGMERRAKAARQALDDLRREIAIGVRQADEGRVVQADPEGLKRRLRQRLDGDSQADGSA